MPFGAVECCGAFARGQPSWPCEFAGCCCGTIGSPSGGDITSEPSWPRESASMRPLGGQRPRKTLRLRPCNRPPAQGYGACA